MLRQSVQANWFVAPYRKINAEASTKKYQPCQVGPAIYDNERVCMNLFRRTNDMKGVAIVMNSFFEIIKKVQVPRNAPEINIHEFNVIELGKSTLLIVPNP